MTKKTNPNTMPVVTIYTDGSCAPNPGKGGWAGVITHSNYKYEIYGGFQHTSSNRMEMMAFIKCLETLTRPHTVQLFSDSRYLVHPIQQGKIGKWVKANEAGKFVKNIDLWRQLLHYSGVHNIQAKWVKGHNNNTDNERCNSLARMIRTTKNMKILEVDQAYLDSLKSESSAPSATKKTKQLQPA